MNELQVFSNERFGEVRTIEENSTIYFCAIDIARALGYSNPHKAIRDHCKDDGVTNRSVIDSIGREQSAKFITEGNVYRLIARSQLPEAEQYERWLFDEVAPTIRKHGAYMTPETLEKVLTDPDTVIRLATELKHEQERRRLLAQKIEADKPKVLFAEAVTSCPDSLIVRDFAKLLRQNGIEIGEKRLFAWFRENGYLMKFDNKPTQRSMELGLFDVTEHIIKASAENSFIKLTTKVTAKGQRYFMEKFLKEKKWDE